MTPLVIFLMDRSPWCSQVRPAFKIKGVTGKKPYKLDAPQLGMFLFVFLSFLFFSVCFFSVCFFSVRVVSLFFSFFFPGGNADMHNSQWTNLIGHVKRVCLCTLSVKIGQPWLISGGRAGWRRVFLFVAAFNLEASPQLNIVGVQYSPKSPSQQRSPFPCSSRVVHMIFPGLGQPWLISGGRA